jgi:hypothetical protein
MIDGILRGVANANEHTARDAWERFGEMYYPYGKVSAVAVDAIPALAELAAVPGLHLRLLFPYVLGDLANAELSTGPDQPAARAAVLAQAGALVPLLDDPQPGVRAGAAYALAAGKGPESRHLVSGLPLLYLTGRDTGAMISKTAPGQMGRDGGSSIGTACMTSPPTWPRPRNCAGSGE